MTKERLRKNMPRCENRTWVGQTNQHYIALSDSGNMPAHVAIDAEFHEKLGIPTEATKIRARATNKQVLEIQGVSKGIYLRFPNVAKTFFMKPLVV